ncbi:hypothetical protein [Desulfofustis limnaeus]|jgi:hypothetical protein|uniref:Uncharacterized protein n=1 Tax=Desulfofustis limnaeus TaxID=2740163 RepID=A0ABN6M3F1_9BACT|nr:hypothetical protein [Desulfofustis limnaeus]MDX9895478.1 hypothetical protein [Desulfofustis sp.]BDD87442.1 hypothetical protein DPPLL_18070 [Desulfofustis limnaeus]
MKKQTLLTGQGDLAGHSFRRVFRLTLLDRVIALGNLRSGPGLKPALVLLVLHGCGRWLFPLMIRYEARLHRVYQLIRRSR